jgi:hypothetical protein
MTSADPLAHERFRTIVSDTLQDFLREHFPNASWFEDGSVNMIASEFPEAHFEYRVNEAGVRVRKVVVESRGEVDPSQDGVDPAPERQAGGIVDALRADYANARAIADGLEDRLRAAITDAVAEHGVESREHQRLRWALSGDRPVDPSPATAPNFGPPPMGPSFL